MPRESPLEVESTDYRFLEAFFLPRGSPPEVGFTTVLHERVSARDFGGPLGSVELGTLLWEATRIRNRPAPANRPEWQSRPYPAAGGCHAIDVLVLGLADHADKAFIYDARHHALGLLADTEPSQVQTLQNQISQVIPCATATVLWFLADIAKLNARYHNPESLLWRNAGAMSATLSFMATALQLPSCLVGIHAPASMDDVLRYQPRRVGVGGMIVALPPSPTSP